MGLMGDDKPSDEIVGNGKGLKLNENDEETIDCFGGGGAGGMQDEGGDGGAYADGYAVPGAGVAGFGVC